MGNRQKKEFMTEKLATMDSITSIKLFQAKVNTVRWAKVISKVLIG